MNDFSFCLFSNTDTAEIDYQGELITDLDTEMKARWYLCHKSFIALTLDFKTLFFGLFTLHGL